MAEVAEATGFVSQYTGDQIEQAISAYLNGNTKTTVTVNVSATTQYWKTSTGSSAKYYTEITTSGSFYVGIYPDIFIVDSSGVKIIPDVDYSAKNGTFKVYSNTMVDGVVVINGMKTTSQMIDFTINQSGSNVFQAEWGENFYTFFNKVEGGHILGLKCDSLNSVVENDGKDSHLYIKNERTPIKGSDVIIPSGVYEIIAR